MGRRGRYPNDQEIFGKIWYDVLKHWLDLPTHHGRIHDIYMWYSKINTRMHCVDMAMYIGTSFYLLVMFDCIITWYVR
jgi:hypothetical protein